MASPSLKAIVAEALALPESQRQAYLESACGADEALRNQVVELLACEGEADGFLEASPMASSEVRLSAGDRVGPYRIVDSLGSGGMGDVYLAERADDAYEQRVAVKVLRTRASLGELEGRFFAERQLLADLEHPNIARLLDGGTSDQGRPYLVMDYVEGEPIDQFGARVSLTERLRLFLDVCSAVAYAHRHLVVHRDLKPANILVTADGQPKLLDFGIAKDLGAAGKTPETRLLVPVTVEYASPEQLAGGVVTTASDVYSLGVVLYELLTGQSPFDSEDPLAGRSQSAPLDRPSTRVRRAAGPLARRLRRQLRGDLDHIVLQALAPKPADRYSSVEQFAREVSRHLAGLPLETRSGVLYRLGKQARRSWRSLSAVAIMLALGGVWLDESLERRALETEFAAVSAELSEYLMGLLLTADSSITGERSEVLEEMLDQGAELITSGAFEDQPKTRAELLNTIGQVYRRQSRFDKAEGLLRESLALTQQYLPPSSDEMAVAYNSFANVLRELGEYPEARVLLRDAITIWRGNHPGDHARLATLFNNLAGVEKDLGLFESSIEHYGEALAMKRRLGSDPVSIAKAIKNLATAQLAAGLLDEAETTLSQALAELDRSEKPQKSARAGIDHHLGRLQRQRGELQKARELIERAYAVRVEIYGEGDHKKTVESLFELALIEELEGNPGRSEELLRRVLAARGRLFGEQHSLAAEVLVALARLSEE
ncbi:MAG: serine/threonine-protein kinase [Acidobacteriota bacterium]